MLLRASPVHDLDCNPFPTLPPVMPLPYPLKGSLEGALRSIQVFGKGHCYAYIYPLVAAAKTVTLLGDCTR